MYMEFEGTGVALAIRAVHDMRRKCPFCNDPGRLSHHPHFVIENCSESLSERLDAYGQP